MIRCLFIRPPAKSKYNDSDVREENLITYALGYLKSQGVNFSWSVADYALEKSIDEKVLTATRYDYYIIAVRETASVPHYAIRIANLLRRFNRENIIIYGQVGRLCYHPEVIRLNLDVIIHSEEKLAHHLFPDFKFKKEISFESGGFQALPYYNNIVLSEGRKFRFRGALETTRGCQYKCKFCYINNGLNHPKRWELRSLEAILKDIMVYYANGIRMFNFMDSEFFGADETDRNKKIEVLKEIHKNFPDIKFMIYARADTISKVGSIEKLRGFGLSSVFVGVESLSDRELRALRKGVQVSTLLRSIKLLTEQNISLYLSFILFNRATTTETLRENIQNLKLLYSGDKSYLLGMPNFVFNFESSWSGEGQYELSNKTYIKWAQYYKQPLSSKLVVYDTRYEPIMEIYRILHYEITKKSRNLNFIINDSTDNVLSTWYEGVSLFCVFVMEKFLKRFEEGVLSIETIRVNIEYLYLMIEKYYRECLPQNLAGLCTEDETLNVMYDGNNISYMSHGWDDVFPPVS